MSTHTVFFIPKTTNNLVDTLANEATPFTTHLGWVTVPSRIVQAVEVHKSNVREDSVIPTFDGLTHSDVRVANSLSSTLQKKGFSCSSCYSTNFRSIFFGYEIVYSKNHTFLNTKPKYVNDTILETKEDPSFFSFFF